MNDCFVLFQLILLLKLVSLVSKYVSSLNFLLSLILLATFFAVDSLNSWVIMYWSCLCSSIFFSIPVIFDFLTKLLTLGILISTAVSSVFVAKPLIFPSISVTFVLKSVCLTKLFTLGTLFSTVVSSVFVARVLIFELQLVF